MPRAASSSALELDLNFFDTADFRPEGRGDMGVGA